MLSLTIALCIVSMIFLFFFILICRILYSILFPTIIAYPYPPPPSSSSNSKQRLKERTVVFAGSFNPIHMGHLAMIQEYIIHHYSKVIIVIGTNPHKRYDVSAQQRANLIRKVIRCSNSKFLIQNCIVQVVANDYVWRIVQRQGAALFVRGIRTWEQDGREERKLQFQNMYGPIVLGPLWYPISTIFIQGMPQYNHVSSTYLRNLIQQYTSQDGTTTGSTGSSVDENDVVEKNEPLEGAGDVTRSKQQKQKDQLYQILRQKLKKLVPESIVDDVIELYGSDQGSWGIRSLVKKDKSI
jgi:pantetheine-phosphate adenylyltransferase